MDEITGVLSWAGADAAARSVHDRYLDLLVEKLRMTIGAIAERADRGRIEAAMSGLSEEGFGRFLAAPETCRRIVWGGVRAKETAGFIAASLEAEAAREGGAQKFAQETWTALGDVGFFPGGGRIEWPRVEAMMPLDFGSPRAREMDLAGREFALPHPRPAYGRDEVDRAFEKIRRALDGIRSASRAAAAFAARFNKVVVVQHDASDPARCSSGSNAQFVGRSFITNVESDEVPVELIAEAVIHEGIHGLLYMHQIVEGWGPEAVIHDQTPRVASPWTGTPLPVRSLMEAAFVWYGLAHFWCESLARNIFEPAIVRRRIARALGGFLKDPLPDMIAPEYRALIGRDVLDALAGAQARVREAFAR